MSKEDPQAPKWRFTPEVTALAERLYVNSIGRATRTPGDTADSVKDKYASLARGALLAAQIFHGVIDKAYGEHSAAVIAYHERPQENA